MAEVASGHGGVTNTSRPLLEDVGAELLFEKVLTACDAASKGRLVLPKKAAVDHFPNLEGRSSQQVSCEDTYGNMHELTHRFWTNVKSRMYLLEGLDSVFRTYKVAAGDVLCFGGMPDGKLVVAARKPGPGDVQRTRKTLPPSERPERNAKAAKEKQPPQPQAPMTRRGAKRVKLEEQPPGPVDSVESEESQDAVYFEPLQDGVFRAVRHNVTSRRHPQMRDHGRFWSVTTNIAGELFQAFYASEAMALQAVEALDA